MTPASSRPAFPRLISGLRRGAEIVAALLLTVVFVSFVLQIVFRYLLEWPVGWTLEVSTLAWTWLVLWGAAFVVRERDEIRFDIVFSAAPARLRRVFVAVAALVLAGLFAVSLPAVVDYVTFMRVERVSYIDLRLDYAFSIYILFALAVIVRCILRIRAAFRGETPETLDQSLLRDE